MQCRLSGDSQGLFSIAPQAYTVNSPETLTYSALYFLYQFCRAIIRFSFSFKKYLTHEIHRKNKLVPNPINYDITKLKLTKIARDMKKKSTRK